MKFYSTNDKTHTASFSQAVRKGLAPDKGLYFPEHIPALADDFFEQLPSLFLPEIGYEVARQYVGNEIPDHTLRQMMEEVLNFPIPLVQVEENIHSLELFHGPTLAFKDVGARFMARMLGHFNGSDDQEVTVLVATSGDTGSAVANGFLGVNGVRVVILYPKGKVSEIQEKQLTTLGNNITAIEVEGVFDDCQALVKEAFMDPALSTEVQLTSANSINIARLVPQSFYYFYAMGQLNKPRDHRTIVSVPSGNFGNLTAGLIAKRMGLPVDQFIAATNVNNVVPAYLESGNFAPRPSTATLSNAMDVGNPSNFARMMELYEHDVERLRSDLKGCHYTDDQTIEAIKQCADETNYILDPHGAIGYSGLKDNLEPGVSGIFLETAHPAKFIDVVEEQAGQKVTIPSRLQECMDRTKVTIQISNNFDELVEVLKS